MATETKLRQLAQGGCPVYYFYSSERYLVRQAVARASKLLAEGEDEETTVLDGATPEIEQLIMAAGTISFFGTRRVVILPEVDRLQRQRPRRAVRYAGQPRKRCGGAGQRV